MTAFFQAQHPFALLQEPNNSAAFTNPKIVVQPSDKLEIIGAESVETMGTLSITWVKVACGKGEGFHQEARAGPIRGTATIAG